MPKVIERKKIVKFASGGSDNFYGLIKQRVEEYFQTNHISPNANTTMRVKTVVMLSLYFVPYLCIATGLTAVSPWVFYAAWVIMGVGSVGIGASVMHDCNHGAYSTNKTVNKILGSVLNLLGGYTRNWRIQHNILHHTYTNLDGLDEDIEGTKLLRMSPHKPLMKIHRYQHIYAWFLYSLMNLYWATVKDYRQIFRYGKEGLLQKEKITLQGAFTELTLLKILYIGYLFVIPMLFSGMAWYHVILGYIVMQMITGLSLACIFQPAHVMETSRYPLPDANRKMEDNWAIHQVLNTSNFAPNSKITSWFIGGLNFQIEHHLFPHVCHVHYPKISKIVKSVAEQHGICYNVQPTVLQALLQHGKMLRELGRS